jgi:hypothetical protein
MPLETQVPGTSDPSKIPSEDIPLVLNSLVCEALLGFTRELDDDGQWKWTAIGEDGKANHELFDLVHNDALAWDMLIRFCQGQPQPFGAQVNYIPHMQGINERPSYQVYILQPDAGGKPSIRAQTTANRLGVGIALALCYVVEADMEMQHRILFPGKYLAIAN